MPKISKKTTFNVPNIFLIIECGWKWNRELVIHFIDGKISLNGN